MAVKLPLYLFAKAPVAGRAKKRLCPPLNATQAAQVAAALLAHSSSVVEKNWQGQCILSVTPDLSHQAFSDLKQNPQWRCIVQPNLDLGGRMADALQQGINQSGMAVVLGTDIPAIDQTILQQVYAALLEGENIIGPSKDGGFYLLGLSKMPPTLFENIKWGSSDVFAQLMNNAQKLGVALLSLPELEDCDYVADLQKLAKQVPAFKRQLQMVGFDCALLS